MCITSIADIRTHLRWMLLWMGMVMTVTVSASVPAVTKLQQSKEPVTIIELFGYASGGFSTKSSLGTANNNTWNKEKDKQITNSYLNVGTSLAVCNTKCEWIRLTASLGYTYMVYSYQSLFTATSGVYTHWLSMDVTPTLGWLGLGLFVGLKTDVFLASTLKNNDHFSFEGLYPDCFNKAALCFYGGLYYQFRHVKFEWRMGSYVVPQINPQKMAYYNLTNASSTNFYFELRVSYRIFTNGRIKKVPGNKLL